MIIEKSQYSGKCYVCGKPYAKDERIEWERSTGAAHAACAEPRQTLLGMLESETLADTLGFYPTGQSEPREQASAECIEMRQFHTPSHPHTGYREDDLDGEHPQCQMGFAECMSLPQLSENPATDGIGKATSTRRRKSR